MPKGVRSARGEMVDFDLLRIKENLGAAPKATTVKAREDFIDSKFKRRMRRMTETVAAKTTVNAPTPTTKQAAPVAQTEDLVEDVSADLTEQFEDASIPAKKKIIKSN